MKIFILSIFMSFQVGAYTIPYNTLDKSYNETAGSTFEIKESTPSKTQDGIGICYGFTSTSLLETYRCKELKLDCQNPHERLSSLDVTSYFNDEQGRGIEEGGVPHSLLKSLSEGSGKIAREDCIPFSSLVNQKGNEKKSLNFLIAKWNEYKGTKTVKANDCVECLVSGIKTSLVNIKTPSDQLKDAFTQSKTVEEFLYKAMLPKECVDEKNAAIVPPFKMHTWPAAGEIFTDETFRKNIESLLLSGIPLELSICSDKVYSPDCKFQHGHSIALYGIKEVCNKSECRTMVKVKNSFGKGWEGITNNGWVDFKTLRVNSLSFNNYFNMTWITKPDFVMPDLELKKNAGHIDSK